MITLWRHSNTKWLYASPPYPPACIHQYTGSLPKWFGITFIYTYNTIKYGTVYRSMVGVLVSLISVMSK